MVVCCNVVVACATCWQEINFNGVCDGSKEIEFNFIRVCVDIK